MDALVLDHAATTQLDARVRARLLESLERLWGNPSSRHGAGVAAQQALEESRRQLGHVLGADPRHVVFTSGGTEANNLALHGSTARVDLTDKRVLIAPDEHSCVRGPAQELARRGARLQPLATTEDGDLDLAAIEQQLDDSVVLVSCLLVNNEVGRIHPIRELASLVGRRAPRAHRHCDAVQALGKLEIDLPTLGVDSLAVSAHKVHGPKGAGALALRPGARMHSLVQGGGQEQGLRSGTQNVPALVAFGLAAELAESERSAFKRAAMAFDETLTEGLPTGFEALSPRHRVPSIRGLVLPGPPAEVWQHHLEVEGVVVGVGAACNSSNKEASPTLRAMGVTEDAARQVCRVSTARTTPEDSAHQLLAALARVAARLETVAR